MSAIRRLLDRWSSRRSAGADGVAPAAERRLEQDRLAEQSDLTRSKTELAEGNPSPPIPPQG